MPEDERKAKAEERFLSGGLSLRALAEEIEVSYGTVRRWSKEGEWMKKRTSGQRKTAKKEAGKGKAEKLGRLREASDELESALLTAARAIARNMDADQEGLLVTDGKDRAGNLSRIIQAVSKQVETRILLEDMMTKETGEGGAVLRLDGEAEKLAE